MQSIDFHGDPLHMFLGGTAGTRKLQVINAIKDYFEQCGQSQQFCVCSYMGVVARNIWGMTLHSVLGINHANSSRGPSQSDNDLTAMWCGVDLLIHQ